MDHRRRHQLARGRAGAGRAGLGPATGAAAYGLMPDRGLLVSGAGSIPEPDRDEPARLRPGEYRYFADPLPPSCRSCGSGCTPALVGCREPMAGGARAGRPIPRQPCRVPRPLSSMPARRGRRRSCCSTGPGDYNCLHQDLYGAHVFPIQVAMLLVPARRRLRGRRVRAHRTAPAHAVARRTSCPSPRETPWRSPSTTAPSRAPEELTVSTCVTA